MMNLPSCPIQNLQVSARLRISEFTWQNAADLARMHQNPRVRELLMDDLPLDTTSAAQRFIDGMQRFYRQHEGTGIWRAERAIAPDAESVAQARQAYAEGEIHETLLALVEAPTWQFCGWFSLVHLMDAPDALEIGARLSPDAWGAALALDGGEWLLNQAFQTLKREQVFGHSTSGKVMLNQINPYNIGNSKLSSLRRNDIAFIFQSYNLVPSLPVFENIVLPLRLSGKKINTKEIKNLLERMKFHSGLNDFVNTAKIGRASCRERV